MTVLELIDELSKQEPHSKVAVCGWAAGDYPGAYAYDDLIHVIPRRGKTETSREPEDLVVLY